MIEVLTGSNSFMLGRALHERVAAFVAEHSDMALERYDGETLELHKVDEIMQAMPFLSAKRMVVIKNASRNKPVAARITELLSAVPDTTELILVEDHPDKRSSFYKTLQKQAHFQDYKELDERSLATWLVSEAKKTHGNLSASDAQYLINRVGPNQLILYQELQKLLLYNPHVTRQTIELLTEPLPQSSVFELLDAAFAGNRERVLQLYKEQRQQKVEPLAMLGMIAWQLHILAIIKTAKDRSADTIANEAKISPFVVRKSIHIAKNIRYAQLKDWVRAAFELDVRLKSENVDADEALQYLLLSFAK